MVKMYGSKICRDCVEIKILLEEKKIPFEFIEITESVANMRSFLKYRDTEDVLQPGKAEGRICIPFFVLDDGRVTTDVNSIDFVKTCECC